MRHRSAAVVVLLTAAVPIFAMPATAEQAHPSRTLPKLVAGSYSGIKPRNIDFSGDAGNIAVNLRWKRWSQRSAVGHGTSNILDCIPNCAQGTATPVATTVTLSKPRRGHFTKFVEVRAGHALVGYYGHPAWPENAQ